MISRRAGSPNGVRPTVVTQLVTQQRKRPLPISRKRPLTWVEMRGFEPLTPSMRTLVGCTGRAHRVPSGVVRCRAGTI